MLVAVSEQGAEAADGAVDAALEVDKGAFGPERLAHLLAGDQAAGMGEQQLQQPQGLRGSVQRFAVFEKLAGVEVEQEGPEAVAEAGWSGRGHVTEA